MKRCTRLPLKPERGAAVPQCAHGHGPAWLSSHRNGDATTMRVHSSNRGSHLPTALLPLFLTATAKAAQ